MSLEDRLARIEDRIEICELRYEYCYTVDSRDWDGYAALHTEDAHIDFGPVGSFEGRKEIRNFAENIVGERHPFLAHMVHNPIIDIDGEMATGKWYFEVPCTLEDGSAGWIQGTYNDEYRRTDGEWLLADVVADFNYFAEYDEGWADIVGED